MAQSLIFHYREANTFLNRTNPFIKLLCTYESLHNISSNKPLWNFNDSFYCNYFNDNYKATNFKVWK